ncbi:MAG: MG2 domain-containing protein [Ferruginibacter sp.]
MNPGDSLYQNKKPIFLFLFFVILAPAFFSSCKKDGKWIDVDPAYSKYVEAYTTGIVSKTSSIRVQLASNASTTHSLGQPVKEDLFNFSPSVKGNAAWIDARTIEFKPEKNLSADQLYQVTFKLGKVTSVPSKYNDFKFSLQTIKPAYKVTQNGLRSTGEKDIMFLNGEVATSDTEEPSKVEKILTASQNNQSYKITWQHSNNNKTHNYTVNTISRSNKENNLTLKWNGSSMDVKNEGQQTLPVPAVNDFKVLNIVSVNDAQQYASVQFSDPVGVGQDLTGLITVSNQSDISFTIDGSEVKVYVGGKPDGNYTVNVNAGIKNNWGVALSGGFTSNVVFENRLPSVRIHGKGNILPTSGKLILPFDAVNLEAVDISIIKIYENSVPQFLQENDLGGNNELRRVSKPIVQKTLRLDDDKTLDLHRRQRFSLDIDKFLKTEPGAIYRVTIGFRPNYSLYSKTVDTTTSSEGNEDDEEEGYGDEYGSSSGNAKDSDQEFWDSYDSYYPYGYNWQRRDDPNSRSYYNKERWATRNILASNIGLTAKRGSNDHMVVAVSSILTTEPMNNVELNVLDYQLQIISKAKSGSDGFAEIALKQKPYLLIAKKGSERGYLKLDDGSSLPLSRFDVGGEEIKNGIKGFVFGERGIWRPGDSMYINCIIEDKTGNLPKDHPVEFNLFTPQGQLYRHAVQSNVNDGFYVFKTSTDASAPTGNWTIKVKVGGAVFDKKIKVETVMPNRLKINLDFGKDAILGNNSNTKGNLSAAWLFGSPGKNLKAKIDASLYARGTVFSKFAGFEFDNPTVDYSTQSKTVFDGTLDEAGHTTIDPAFKIEGESPGMLTANLLVKVFEPGGSFSIDNMSIPYSPYSSYAGIKLPDGEKPFDFLLTGKTHAVQIVNVDNKGNLISGSNEMEVQFYKIQWRWWWDEGGDNLSNFTQNEYNKLIKKEDIALVNGRGQWQFRTAESEWGRYLLLVKDKKSGHTTGSAFYVDEPGWQARSGNEGQSAASMLSFTSNKEKYTVGEEVSLTIPSSKGGRMLVSLESGSSVIKSFWEETKQGQTTVTFKADADMAPNIYVTVSLLQPHAQSINDLPIRMYGSIPVFIEDKNTVLKPLIAMPESIRPEQQVSITVSEEKGKEMTYCIAVVDEGLLDLTRFKTPDPHAVFYAREALGIKTFDLYDQVIGAWGGDLERILTIGGDSDAGPAKQKRANRFKPVVKYLGPFTLSARQKQTQTFKMPAYVGSVRTMVVAAHKGSYGFAEKAVSVKKPVMVLATMPRVLSPGETLKLPVTVFAMEKNIRTVKVSLQANNFMEVLNGSSQSLNFTETGEQLAYFDVRIKDVIGIAKVKVTASSGSENAADDVEIDIRNPNPVITNVQQVTLAPGQQWTVSASPIGIAALSTSAVEVSSIPSMNLQRRLSYLIEYPHGCIEQTTSAAFPQLVLNQLTELSDFQKSQVDKNVKAGISKLQSFQQPDGGFSYWPGIPGTDEWGSNYAGHFLVEAQNNGFFVSDLMLQQWKNYQKGKSNNWIPSTTNFYGGDLIQAYRLYTLALAKSAELGAMNRLKEFKYLSVEAKWRLAAAYKLAGQDNTAMDLISGLSFTFYPRVNPGITYGSDLRDQAMVLETLTLMGKRDKAGELLTTVAAKLSEDSWYSTQTTAYSLIAIAKYCGKNSSGSKIIASFNINGVGTDINSLAYLRQLPVLFKNGVVPVTITNNGSNTLYVKLITRGQPLTGDSVKAVTNPSVLVMNIEYISQNALPVDVSKLTQGSDFIAKVTVKNTGKRGAYTQMALSQMFPSGWEILNARMMDGEGTFKSSPFTYQDVRDDRVYSYFNIRENEILTYYIQLNAAYLGRYYLPSTNCQAMYDNTISAASSGRWIEVIN